MSGLPLPDTVTIENLSGRWTLDKALSENIEESMDVQGLSWFIRKIINVARIVLTAYHDGLDLRIVQGSDSVKITATEYRHLDWSEVENKISIFGTLKGQSRILTVDPATPKIDAYSFHGEDTLEDAEDLSWLAADWIADDGKAYKLLETQGKCLEQGWRNHQIWGFGMVDGNRRHVRKMVTWNKGRKVRTLLHYHWLGPLAT